MLTTLRHAPALRHRLQFLASQPRCYTSLPSDAHRKWQLSSASRPRSILEDDEAGIDLSEDNEIVNGTRPNTPLAHLRLPPDKPTPHEWRAHREAIRKEFPQGWSPPRKLSREAMDGLRQLHQLDPEKFNTPMLAERFRISPEAVRRILKSKWEPSREKRMKLVQREKETKSEKIRSHRLKEQIEARQLADLRKMSKVSGVQGTDATRSTDDFTFE